MFAPRTVFLDLETTGLSPREDGITEIGALIVEGAQAPVEWTRLVRPPQPIPPEIARMTGITNAMVADAPPFAALADELAALLAGALLVAHNARFDYAFLKQAFAREGRAFFVPTLCTARLARELDPAIEHAGLDALAERYGLPDADRHRALGDARITHALARHLVAGRDPDDVAQAVKRVLRRPSLPKHLPVDSLARLPEGPGVYLFHGLNEHPLYIGKAKSLRERIGSHFSGDWMSERGARLSEELRRIEVIETAGELSALLLEARLVRERMPSHNVLLRRRDEAVVVRLDHDARAWRTLAAADITPEEQASMFGPFASRRQARATLLALAGEAGLCLKVLGLERRRRDEAPDTPCFAYQVRRCAGACCGHEAAGAHWSRFVESIAPLALPAWPHEHAVELTETDAAAGRVARFTVRDWRLVGEDGTLAPFDRHAYRILRPYVEGRRRNARVTLVETRA